MRAAPCAVRSGGFALAEVILATAIGVAALGVASSLTGTTTRLARTSHAESRVHAEHRRGLMATADALRTAVLGSLSGFVEGETAQPSFRRILGVGWHEHFVGDVEQLVWRPPAAGATPDAPGAVWLVGPGGATLVADRVPAGGFTVRQEGAVLAICLTTSYIVDGSRYTTLTSETAVSLRN